MATVRFENIPALSTSNNGWYDMNHYVVATKDLHLPEGESNTVFRLWMINRLNGEIIISHVWSNDAQVYRTSIYFSDPESATIFLLKYPQKT